MHGQFSQGPNFKGPGLLEALVLLSSTRSAAPQGMAMIGSGCGRYHRQGRQRGEALQMHAKEASPA
jgi:hypothetical protein